MIKKTITYVDYNDVERIEDFYFNLTKAELMEMELGISGGLSEAVDKVIKAKDIPSLIKVFKEIVMKAYGVKSPDGKRFIKNDEVRNEFIQTEAYSEIFMELATDDLAAAEFIKGIMPKDVSDKVDDVMSKDVADKIREVAPQVTQETTGKVSK